MEFLNNNLDKEEVKMFPCIVELSAAKWEFLQNNNANLTLRELVRLMLFLFNKRIYPKPTPINEFLEHYSLSNTLTVSEIELLNKLFKRFMY